MNKLKGSFLLCLLPLFSCVHIPTAPATGPNLVTGHATLSTNHYSRPCEDIMIVPATDEIRNLLFATASSSDLSFIDALDFRSVLFNKSFQSFAREVNCQSDGSFEFGGISDGNYFLIARVTWLMRLTPHGGFIIRPLTVIGPLQRIEIVEVRDSA